MLKKLSQCIGLASIILVMNYGSLLGGGHEVRMHVPYALHAIVYAQLTDILLLGLLLFAVLAPLARTRFGPWVPLALCIVLPPYLLERVQAAFLFPVPNSLLIVFAVAWTAILLLLLLRYKRLYAMAMRAVDFAGIFFAAFFLFTLAELLYMAHWKPGPQMRTVAWATTPQPPRQHPLLVWVIFDELSYNQVFEHRAPNLTLPNFDALRSQSTVFSDVQPAGNKTVKVLPSLITGRLITAYNFTFDNRFMVHYDGTPGLQKLDPSAGIFADAQRQGWRTAVVGWYNPYCLIYAGTIDDCYWMNLDQLDGPMSQTGSFWQNTWSPLRQAVKEIISPARARRSLCNFDVQHRYRTHIDLEQHSMQLLHTDQADLMMLHLPIPHSPNIWSRTKGGYTQQCDSSYADNLALADRELGRILAQLESSPRWRDTTLIVQGDHSWRNYLWVGLPAWTDEDDAISQSGFDPRPAVIIHQAGQTQPQVNATAWSLLNVHAVIEQVLHGGPVRY